jgi:putative colanic acid biosynthesis acetyltransferase WcaF
VGELDKNSDRPDDLGIRQGIDPFTKPSFSMRNRLFRLLWMVSSFFLFRFIPRPFHWWRNSILRLFGARIGIGCHVHPSVSIWAPWNLVMDDFASMGSGVICYSMATVHLGKKVVVSQRCHLCTGTHDYKDPAFQLIARPIIIRDEAWIAAESFVGPGVTVGEGAVIGARSVVIKDMPPWTVCAGNPSVPIKPRVVRDQAHDV